MKRSYENIAIDSIRFGGKLPESDNKSLHVTEEIRKDQGFQSELRNSNRGFKLNSKYVLEMIQSESNSVNNLRETVKKRFSKDLKFFKRIIIQNSNSREDIRLQEQKLEQKLNETRNVLQTLRKNESHLQTQLSDKEKTLLKLKRSLDEATLQISKAVLERTRFMKERDSFEKCGREYKDKYDDLLSESAELHTKLAKLEHENAQFHNQWVLNETNVQQIQHESVSVDTSPKNSRHQPEDEKNDYIQGGEIGIFFIYNYCY